MTNAQGRCIRGEHEYIMVDIPGTYSLMAHSAEEEVARDFICFGGPDAVIVVCDATCLERNMNLVLQTLEITGRVVVCVNLMDEAHKKHIRINFEKLQEELGVPVVGASARGGKGLDALMNAVNTVTHTDAEFRPHPPRYPYAVERALALLTPAVESVLPENSPPARWVALKLLSQDLPLSRAIETHLGLDILGEARVSNALEEAEKQLASQGITVEKLRDMVVSSIVLHAEETCADAVTFEKSGYNAKDRKLDRLLTSRATGIPVMLLLLAVIFWLTITGANYPSQLLSGLLFGLEEQLAGFLTWAGAPAWLVGALADGVFRVLACVMPPDRDAEKADKQAA